MNSILELLSTILGIYTSVILLRIWLQMARADFYNPFSQFVVKATQPILAPLRRMIPSIGKWDTAAILFALFVSYLKAILLNHNPIVLNELLIIGLLYLFYSAYYLLFGVLILRAILSWVSQGNHPIEYLMGQLTEPLLSPIRRIIPPIGGLDLSMLVLILGLQFMLNFVVEILS